MSAVIPCISGDIISFNNTLTGYNAWCPQILIEEKVYSFTAANALSGLSDTNITTPIDGNILLYNATSSKWENKLSSENSANICTLSTPQTLTGQKIYTEPVNISKNATSPSTPLSISNS